MNKPGLIIFLGVVGGFAASFLGLGLLWVGLKTPVQMCASILFFFLSFLVTKFLKNKITGFAAPVCGAAPIASLLVQFRDKEGSHLSPILVVATWGLAAFLGAWLGEKSAKKS